LGYGGDYELPDNVRINLVRKLEQLKGNIWDTEMDIANWEELLLTEQLF
jgi:hypothetical protein